jgi:hypothetical protein
LTSNKHGICLKKQVLRQNTGWLQQSSHGEIRPACFGGGKVFRIIMEKSRFLSGLALFCPKNSDKKLRLKHFR